MAEPTEAKPRESNTFDATRLTHQFEQLLSTKRLNHLANRSNSRRSCSKSPAPYSIDDRPRSNLPSYSSLRNLPTVPTPPQDQASIKFRSLLVAHSMAPLQYENPGLLDEALAIIPMANIYNDAEDEHNMLQAQAVSIGSGHRSEWGYQDCVIRALLRYVLLRCVLAARTHNSGGSSDHL